MTYMSFTPQILVKIINFVIKRYFVEDKNQKLSHSNDDQYPTKHTFKDEPKENNGNTTEVQFNR